MRFVRSAPGRHKKNVMKLRAQHCCLRYACSAQPAATRLEQMAALVRARSCAAAAESDTPTFFGTQVGHRHHEGGGCPAES